MLNTVLPIKNHPTISLELFGHIPGKANYAAEFILRIKTDRTETVSLKLNEKIPMSEMEIDTEAKTPNAELNSITTMDKFFDQEATNEAFISQLKFCGLYEWII